MPPGESLAQVLSAAELRKPYHGTAAVVATGDGRFGSTPSVAAS